MSTTFIEQGHALEFAAPSGGVTNGTPVILNSFFVIPQVTAAVGVRFPAYINGVHLLPKTTTDTWTEGQAAFWDAANGKVSNDSTVGQLPIGAIHLAATSSDTTGYVRLNGQSFAGRPLNVRKRFSVSQVNAGATLLPAMTGAKYRMVMATAIAIGGAAGAVTTVDILATLSAASRKLVAFAQASLTQSTVLRDGATGATVLADGASYTANDISTAITVGITGASVTTATSIDFSLTYTIE